MTFYHIYSHPILRRYKTSVCSTATFLYLVISISTLVAPLLIAYWTQGFWLKEAQFREQPEVHFSYQFIFIAEGEFSAASYVGFSSYQAFNNLLDDNQRICLIKSHEADNNGDGKLDSLNFQMQVPMAATDRINQIKLILQFDYKLHTFSSVQMQSIAFIQHSSPLDGAQFSVVGQLSLDQRYPIPSSGSYTVYNVSVFDAATFSGSFNIEEILRLYSQRNVSTKFNSMFPLWKSTRAPSEPFVLDITMAYPEETIIYRPGFWQIMKMAWVQYIAILVVFAFASGQLKRLLFESQLVDCIPQPDTRHL